LIAACKFDDGIKHGAEDGATLDELLLRMTKLGLDMMVVREPEGSRTEAA